MELNIKLAEWVGFKWIDKVAPISPTEFQIGFWQKDNQNYLPEDIEFTNSLDACFKNLEPELRKRGWHYELLSWNGDMHKAIIIKPTKTWAKIMSEAIAETASLAFCGALEKLIDDTN